MELLVTLLTPVLLRLPAVWWKLDRVSSSLVTLTEKEFVEAFHALLDCTRSLRLSAKESVRFPFDGTFGGGRTGPVGGQYEEARGSQSRLKRGSVEGFMLDAASAADVLYSEARYRTCWNSVNRSTIYT